MECDLLTHHICGFRNQLVNRNRPDFILFCLGCSFSLGVSHVALGRSLEILFRAITKCWIPRGCCLSGSVLASGDGISEFLNGNSSTVTPQRSEIQVDTLWPKFPCTKCWNYESRQAWLEQNFNLCSTPRVAEWMAWEQEPEQWWGMLVISWSWNAAPVEPGTTGTAPAQSVPAQVEARGWEDFWDNHPFFKRLLIFFPQAVSHQFYFQVWAAGQGMSSLPTRNGARCGSWQTPPRAINSVVDGQGGRAKTRIGNVLILSGIVLLWQEYRLDYLISHHL